MTIPLQHHDIDNPGQKIFGVGSFTKVAGLIDGRKYCSVTYPEPHFARLMAQVSADTGAPVAVIDDAAPNPDFSLLAGQAARLKSQPEVFVAIDGGSVIDTTKALTNPGDFWDALKDFSHVRHVSFGHIHRPTHGSWHGIPFSSVRATAHQVALKLDDADPEFILEDPSFAVVLIAEHQVVIHDHTFTRSDPSCRSSNAPKESKQPNSNENNKGNVSHEQF